MGALKLTDTTVGAVACPPGKKDLLLFDTVTKGFGLRVTAGGKRIFLYQYRVGPKVRRHKLGEWPALTVAKARRLVEIERCKVHEGGDPVAARRSRQAAIVAAEAEAARRKKADAFTVAAALEQWREGHLASRRPSYQAAATKRLRAALAEWLEQPAAGFDQAKAVEALDQVKAGFGPIAANRVRAYGRACFGWAHKRGTLPGNPFAAVPKPAQERARDRVLNDDELARVWQAAAELEQPWRAIVQLLILTGQRRGEVAGMAWAELTLEPAATAVWRMPGARTKNGHAHDVPLSTAALAVLAEVPRFAGCPLALSLGRPRAPSGSARRRSGSTPSWPAQSRPCRPGRCTTCAGP